MPEHVTPSTARPPVVTAAAVVLFVVGGLNAILGFLLFGVGVAIGALFGVLSLAIAAAAIFAGVQVLALKATGRTVGLAVAGLGIVTGLYSIIAQGNVAAIIGLILYGFVIWVLVTNAELFQA